MKFILFTMLLTVSASCYSQNGYFNLGSSALIEKKTMNNSITMGAGFKYHHLSAGIVSDFYVKKNGRYIIPALDFRYYLKEGNSPYITLQPGYVLYEKTFDHIKVSGSYAAACLIGYELIGKKEVGLNISAGWQYTSFKTLGVTSKGNAIRINLSMNFQ